MILGIDPSLKSTGWAVLDEEGKIYEFGNLKLAFDIGADKKDKTISVVKGLVEVLRSFKDEVDLVVIEVPLDYGNSSKTSANNLTPLWGIAGAVLGMFSDCKLLMYTPREWKGTMPKTKHNLYRTMSKLSECDRDKVLHRYNHTMATMEKRATRNNIDDPIGDVLDAIGLCQKGISHAKPYLYRQ